MPVYNAATPDSSCCVSAPLASRTGHSHLFFARAKQDVHISGARLRGRVAMSLNDEDMIMRHFDLSPLYRSTVGFDRLFSLLDQVNGADVAPAYPPYNIERTGETSYRITLAVAGFAESDLNIEVKENCLQVRGSKEAKTDEQPQRNEVLYQGIAARAFERRFQLADHVKVTSASLQNGLLHIDLVREIPEAQKPRQISIGGAKVVDALRAA
jgi:molecular chaperone IbpA